MNRRHFTSSLAAVGLSSLPSSAQGSPAEASVHAEQIQLSRNGWMPNNDKLPVLFYRRVFAKEIADPATWFESAFRRNGWPPQWRNGVYGFHHYHSTAHEVLGFAAGYARLMLGGENGREVTVTAGDVLLLPTGTGHCKIGASSDFLVVGAYPPGQIWDICRSEPSASARNRMQYLPFPESDPVSGASGPLAKFWRRDG